MKKVAIVVDAWKLAIFERRLTEGGYAYEQVPGLKPNMLALIVKTGRTAALQRVVELAQMECGIQGP